MRARRLWQSLTFSAWRARRCFPPAALQSMQQTISGSEASHLGEVRLVIEGSLSLSQLLSNLSPRQRAVQLFSEYRVWDTEHNTGVLVYLLLAERRLEIVADRGISARVSQEQWDALAARMREQLAAGQWLPAVQDAVQRICALLEQHFPSHQQDNPNELSDAPILLL